MPYWKTHIEIGKRVNKYLKYENEDLEKFLFANCLPDINNSELLTHIATFIPHEVTHFKMKGKETYQNFALKYAFKLKENDPLYWGYLLHLFVDFYWNSNFYKNVKNTAYKNTPASKLKDVKHYDFNIYNARFHKNILSVSNKDELLKDLKGLKEVKIKEKDIDFVLNFLKNQETETGNLKFFTKDALNKLMINTVKEFKRTVINKK